MASIQPELILPENIERIVNSFDTICTDCDGVLWDGQDTIPGSVETIQKLVSLGKRVFYVTNNSTKTRKEYMAKCASMGYPAEKESCVIGTAYVTASYIKNVLNYTGVVYCIGSSGLTQEFDAVGIRHIGTGPDSDVVEDMEKAKTMKTNPEVKCVVVGYDKHFSYTKMTRAASYLQQPDCHFIGTNIDSGMSMGHDRYMPGTGSIIKAVEFASQRDATYMGKPNALMVKSILKEENIDPKRTLMIGDRLNTDIGFATNCGFQSLLVQTGVSDRLMLLGYKDFGNFLMASLYSQI